MFLHDIQNLFLQLQEFYKSPVSTLYTAEKYRFLPNSPADFLKVVKHHPWRFLWAFRGRGRMSGTGLMVFVKIITIFAV